MTIHYLKLSFVVINKQFIVMIKTNIPNEKYTIYLSNNDDSSESELETNKIVINRRIYPEDYKIVSDWIDNII